MKENETIENLKEQLKKCINYLSDEKNYYNGLIEPLNIFNIARYVNKLLYWSYNEISNYEYLSNSEILADKIKNIIVIHTQFLLNDISEKIDTENAIKSVINEITNNQYEKNIKHLKKG